MMKLTDGGDLILNIISLINFDIPFVKLYVVDDILLNIPDSKLD